MRILLNQRVPMSDGVELATDVFMPDGPGPFPAVLVRIPYHKRGNAASGKPFTDHGYALALQDVRGKFDSDGEFEPLINEAADGHDAIDWVANQRWCDGRVATWGRSYYGMTQIYAASGAHEALRAIVPSIAPASYFTDWVRYDGCFGWGNAIRWALTHATVRTNPPEGHVNWAELFRMRTLDEVEAAFGLRGEEMRRWLEHDTYDDYWAARDQLPLMERIQVPGYHTGGWFDHITRGDFQAYTGITAAPQKLLIGPWGHITSMARGRDHTHYGDWAFGEAADFDVMGEELRFLDHVVQERDNGWDSEPPVRLFLIGRNEWIGLDDWPPPNTESLELSLTPAGDLTPDSSSDGAVSIAYDAADPVPNLGGAIYWGFDPVGPVDQRPILGRCDVLSWKSAPLSKDTAVIGEMFAHLWIAADVEDTDIVTKLCVEEPSGAVTVLTNGSLRCRYRESWSAPEPLTPGEPAELRLDLGRIAYVFPEGSRIVLIVTCSEFPRILPHVNRYVPTLDMALGTVDPAVAHVDVLCGGSTPSRIVLPVLDV